MPILPGAPSVGSLDCDETAHRKLAASYVMKIVGLTGGIATGKSTVSAEIQRQQVPLIDCDKIAHAVVKEGRWGHRRVVKAFGPSVLQDDGELDRPALSSIIFSDRAARAKLNKATHLPVFAEILRQLFLCWLRFSPLVVVDMPLLFETNSHKLVGANVLVTCSTEVQIERLMKRDACTRQQAEAKIAAQMPLDQKRKLSDIVIDNDGSHEDTKQQTLKALQTLKRHSWLHTVLLGPGMLCILAVGALKLCL